MPIESFLLLLMLAGQPFVSAGFADLNALSVKTDRRQSSCMMPVSGLKNADLIQTFGGAANRRDSPFSSKVSSIKGRKLSRLPINKLAKLFEEDLVRTSCFVTGDVNPRFYCDDFVYADADVTISSLEEYASDVNALFDQDVSKAEVVETVVVPEDSLFTCQWRLSGKANVLWGLNIKPCYVFTDLFINRQNGLIQRQEDRYSIPQWDMVLSAIFPFLNGILTAPPAPPVSNEEEPQQSKANQEAKQPAKQQKPRASTQPDPVIETPSDTVVNPIDAFNSRAGIMSYFVRSPPLQEIEAPKVSKPVPKSVRNAKKAPPQSPAHVDADHSTPPELLPYSDVEFHPRNGKESGTRALTAEEMGRKMDTDSPFHELFHFVQGTLNGHKRDIPWHAVVADSEEGKPEIRAVLSDGTKIPAIRAPSWKDRAKNYIPDRAETRASLQEATRRAESRRFSKWYGYEYGDEEDQELYDYEYTEYEESE